MIAGCPFYRQWREVVVGPPHKFTLSCGIRARALGLDRICCHRAFTRRNIRVITRYLKVPGGQLACAFVCWLGGRAQVGAV